MDQVRIVFRVLVPLAILFAIVVTFLPPSLEVLDNPSMMAERDQSIASSWVWAWRLAVLWLLLEILCRLSSSPPRT
jgi:hypothetical protein